MLRSLLFISIFFGFVIGIKAQETKSDQDLLDSLLSNDPFLRGLDSMSQPVSYAIASLSIGNRLFSVKNNSLNSLQSESKLVLTPGLAYYHKSGLGIAVAANFLKETEKFDLYQWSLTPSYDYSSKKWGAGISYTRYFTKDDYTAATSPIKNEIYAYGVYKKPWLRPVLSLGYASGKYKELIKVDTVIKPPGQPPTHIKFTDSITTSIKSFTVSAGVEHIFDIYGVFSPLDILSLHPQLSINAGSNSYKTTHHSSTAILNGNPQNRRKISRFNEESDNSGFAFQSLGLSFSADYGIRKFSLRPYFYLDYYLPETDEKRFTFTFNVSLGYTF